MRRPYLHLPDDVEPDIWRKLAPHMGSILCVSTADFDAPLWTNKQHLMVRLAEIIPVRYVDSLGQRPARLSSADLKRILRRLGALTRSREKRSLPSRLKIISPIVIPGHKTKLTRRFNRALLSRQLGDLRVLPRPRILWTYTPLAVAEVDLSVFDKVIYHCVDDFATVPGIDDQVIRKLEITLAAAADTIFATTPVLAERLGALNSHTYLTRNVADVDHFGLALNPGPLPPDLATIPEPRAMFVGALTDYKVDWALMNEVSANLADWSFVFIGPSGEEQAMRGWRELEKCPNCYFMGYRRYEDLPAYLRGAEVGIIPYLLSPHTSAVFPLKAVEYLAAGLPVVSTRLDSLASDPSLPMDFADSASDFAAAVVGRDRSQRGQTTRLAAAQARTWDRLLDGMMMALGHVT